MTLLVTILVSSAILAGLILARVYEIKSGKNVWRMLGLAGALTALERYFSKAIDRVSNFDSKNIAEHLKNMWRVLKVFYFALQRLATEKVAQDRQTASQNGNRAASFYLKEIKEHKEKSQLEQSEIDDKLKEAE